MPREIHWADAEEIGIQLAEKFPSLGLWVIVVGGLPLYHDCTADAVATACAMVMLVASGFAQQTEVALAFGRSGRTVRRYQQLSNRVCQESYKSGCQDRAGKLSR